MSVAVSVVLCFLPAAASASLFCAVLRLPSLCATTVATGVVFLAQVVLGAHILSLFGAVGYEGFLLFHWLVFLLALAVWRSSSGSQERSSLAAATGSSWLARARALPWDLVSLLVLVTAAYAVLFVLCVIVAPSTPDSMSYHLPRAAYWIQNGSVAAFETPDPRQVVFPPNAEIGIMWTMILAGSDRLASLVQWSAALLGAWSIYGIAQLGDWTPRQRLFAPLAWMCFPEVLLQSATTQNDLVAAALCVAAAYLSFFGARRRVPRAFVVGGVAAGLAVGAKLTSLLVLPFVLFGGAVMALRRLGRSGGIVFVGAGLLGGVVFAAPIYLSNLSNFGHPLGPPEWVSRVGNQGSTSTALVVTNLARYGYELLDVTGLPLPVAEAIQPWKVAAGSAVFEVLGIDPLPAEEKTIYRAFSFERPGLRPHPGRAWFGPLGALLLPASIIIAAVRGVRRRDLLRLTLAASAIGFAVLASAVLSWNPWAGRHFVVFATIAAPLLGECWIEKPSAAVLRYGLVALCVAITAVTLTTNSPRRLIGKKPIWKEDRIGQQCAGRRTWEAKLRRFEELLPDGTSIGFVSGANDWHYPLFGQYLTRRVTPLSQPEDVATWLEGLDFDIVVARNDIWRGPRGGTRFPQTVVGRWRFIFLTGAGTDSLPPGEFSSEPMRIGVFRDGAWLLDDGNGKWDGCEIDACFEFGAAGDQPVAGDWDSDGDFELGVYRDGRWIIDDGDGQWDDCRSDRCLGRFGRAGDLARPGVWRRGGNRQLAVVRRGRFVIDDGNNRWDNCEVDLCGLSLGRRRGDLQLGDWDGDGDSDMAVRVGRFWHLDNGDGELGDCSEDRCVTAPDLPAGAVAVVGDWNGDGKDDIGAYWRDQWQLDNGNGAWEGCEVDYCYRRFGLAGDLPVVWRGPLPGVASRGDQGGSRGSIRTQEN